MTRVATRSSFWLAMACSQVAFAEVTPIGDAEPQRDGLVMVTLAVPTNVQGEATAVTVARLLRTVATNTPGFTHKDLESLLDDVAAPPHQALLADALKQKEKADLALSMVDLPVAADAYAQSLVAFEQAAAGLRDISPVVDALDRQATTFALQNDTKAARQAWERALALDPGFRVAADAAPRAKKAFDELVKNYRAPPMGKLTIYTTSGAAEVWVDGVARGVAPLTLEVPAGRHLVALIHDGFRAFGTAVDVKKGVEASVQAALKPTKGYAKLDAMLGRIAKNPDGDGLAAELARTLKVDRLMLITVAQSTTAVTIAGKVVDGVSGKTIASSSKAMVSESEFFERDVSRFAEELLQSHDRRMNETTTPTEGGTGKDLLVGDVAAVPVPGGVVAGGVLLGLSVLPLAGAITLGIVTLQQSGQYRIRAQVDKDLDSIRQTWLLTSLASDGLYVATAALLGLGTFFLVTGLDEWSTKEEVMGANKPAD
jgi:PEGA domain